jgi:copper(I)-binding protein
MRVSSFLPLVAVFLHFSAISAESGQAWMRAMPPGQPTAAAYVTIGNPGDTAIRVVAGSSPLAESVEIHESSQEQGVWRMRRLPTLEVPPGGEIVLEPGGIHIMLFGIRQPLKAGDTVPLVLETDAGETLEFEIEVRAMGSGSQHHHQHH